MDKQTNGLNLKLRQHHRLTGELPWPWPVRKFCKRDIFQRCRQTERCFDPEALVSSSSDAVNCWLLLLTFDKTVDDSRLLLRPFVLLPSINTSPPWDFPECVIRFWRLPWIKLSEITPSCRFLELEIKSLISYELIEVDFLDLNTLHNFECGFSGCGGESECECVVEAQRHLRCLQSHQ